MELCHYRIDQEAKKYGKPLIGVHFDGRPISSGTADELLDAMIEAMRICGLRAESASFMQMRRLKNRFLSGCGRRLRYDILIAEKWWVVYPFLQDRET